MIEPITNAVVAPDDRPMSKLFQTVDKSKVFGRGLAAYYPMEFDHAGGFGRMDEAGEFPAPKASTNVEGKLPVIKQAISFALTNEALQAMAGGREQLRTSVDRLVMGGLRTHKAREEYQLFGRGDGAVARIASGATATSVTSFTATTPIRAVEGDQVIWFERRGASAFITSTAAYVTSIDHENSTFDVSTSPSNTIASKAICYLKSTPTAGTIGTDWEYGLEAFFDAQTGSTVGWDSEDSATKQNVQTYMNLSRSTYSKMRTQIYDPGTSVSLSISLLQVAPAMSFAKGVAESNMIYIMHPKMFRRWMVLFSGAMRIETQDVQLPLGKVRLPVIVGAGLTQVPVIQSYYFPDGFMLLADMTDFIRLDINPEWVPAGGGSKWHLMPGTTEFTDVRHAYYRYYGNKAAKKPYLGTVVKDLTTS
jgi:hypothetical protein